MKRRQLEHILRASAAITGADRFVVIGSQAILGQFPDPPEELLVSIEADVFSLRDPHDADLIDGTIGEASLFHQTFGYYAHGVGEKTAVLPEGWRERLIPLQNPNTGGATGLCLEVHDLAVSKLVAGRDKDLDYVSALLKHRLANSQTIQSRLSHLSLDADRLRLCFDRLGRMAT